MQPITNTTLGLNASNASTASVPGHAGPGANHTPSAPLTNISIPGNWSRSGRSPGQMRRIPRPTREAGRAAALRYIRAGAPVEEEASIGGRAMRVISHWAYWAARSVSNLMPEFSVPPPSTTSQQSVVEPKKTPKVVLGLGGYGVFDFDYTKRRSPEARAREISSYDELKPSIEAVAGEGSVLSFEHHYYPYPRNLASEGPHSMVTSNIHKLHDEDRSGALARMEAEFKRRGIKFERVSEPVNFADVDYMPSTDLLVLASTPENRGPLAHAQRVENELRRVFGDPKNVIRYELDAHAVDKQGRLKCYDADLAMHLMRNKNGDPVALVHKPCIVTSPTQKGILSRDQVLEALGSLGFKVIEISAADQTQLATNALSIDSKPGHALFPSDKISATLKSKLEANGIEAHYSVDGKVLGGNMNPRAHLFGVHCLTVNLRRPESEIERERQ